MNKTDRKNKTNLIVNWPASGGYFTIKDLLGMNPDFKEITLRVRVDRSIKKDKTVAILGYKNSGKGRPNMILAMHPVTQELLDKAYNQDDIQPTEVRPLINVINVTSISTPVLTSENSSIEIPVNSSVSETSVEISSETVTA